MPIATPFNAPTAKGRPKAIKIRDGTDVAARYFVYKIYDATGGQPMQWAALRGMAETAATISRAVERGWVVLQGSKSLDGRLHLPTKGGAWPARGDSLRARSRDVAGPL